VSDQIQVTKTVDAAPDKLFALLSTPSRHTEFDGAGMVQGVEGSGEQVSGVGDQFIMNMNNGDLGDYQMLNTVTSFEQDRTIGWAPQIHPLDGYTDKIGDVTAKGHSYTWELAPGEGGTTTVTQTYDWSGVTDEQFRGFFPMVSEQQLTDSIDRAARAAS
jgi:uncharacterized protein YndB with AHSA1/START domain